MLISSCSSHVTVLHNGVNGQQAYFSHDLFRQSHPQLIETISSKSKPQLYLFLHVKHILLVCDRKQLRHDCEKNYVWVGYIQANIQLIAAYSRHHQVPIDDQLCIASCDTKESRYDNYMFLYLQRFFCYITSHKFCYEYHFLRIITFKLAKN